MWMGNSDLIWVRIHTHGVFGLVFLPCSDGACHDVCVFFFWFVLIRVCVWTSFRDRGFQIRSLT